MAAKLQSSISHFVWDTDESDIALEQEPTYLVGLALTVVSGF